MTPKIHQRIEKLEERKRKYELIASQYLMKANDIQEKIWSLLPKEKVAQ